MFLKSFNQGLAELVFFFSLTKIQKSYDPLSDLQELAAGAGSSGWENTSARVGVEVQPEAARKGSAHVVESDNCCMNEGRECDIFDRNYHICYGLRGLLDGQPGRLRLAGGAADRGDRGRRRAELGGDGQVHERVREEQAGCHGEDQRVQGKDEGRKVT